MNNREEHWVRDPQTGELVLAIVFDERTLQQAIDYKVLMVNGLMQQLLQPDDGYRLRKATTGEALPTAVLMRDQAIRTAGDEAKTAIKALTTITEVDNYDYTVPFIEADLM